MDSVERLKQRVDLAKESDQVLGMFFDSVIRRIATTAGDAAAEDVRSRIIGKKRLVGFFKYPVGDLLRAMQLGAERMPGDFAGNLEGFGSAAVEDFFASPVGKTLSSLAGTNIHRVISSAPASYRACSSFGAYGYEKLDDSGARLTYEQDFMGPSAQLGVVRSVLKSACKVEPKLTVSVRDLPATTYTIDIRW